MSAHSHQSSRFTGGAVPRLRMRSEQVCGDRQRKGTPMRVGGMKAAWGMVPLQLPTFSF